MMFDGAVRFWQPAHESTTDFLGGYLETGLAAAHVHEEWQFAVAEVPSGVSIGAFRRHAVHSSDVIAIAPYEVHTERGGAGPAPGWRVLHVAAPVIARLCNAPMHRQVRSRAGFRSPVLADPGAAAELRALLRDSESGELGNQFLPRALGWLRRFLDRHATERIGPSISAAVERALRYLHERPTELVSLQDIVAVADVTVSHLVRSFSRAVGLPPMSYHAQVRLARARRFLSEGKSVTWTAYECGFADQSHLTRRFKEYCGLTPGAFRAQAQAERVATAITGPAAAELSEVDWNAA
jgi:AraC-like DNA-binding protein